MSVLLVVPLVVVELLGGVAVLELLGVVVLVLPDTVPLVDGVVEVELLVDGLVAVSAEPLGVVPVLVAGEVLVAPGVVELVLA